ncbi:MAG TPA: gamma-glutamylcyclotransferase family protein [Verrucomicrobiota bacterium]|jgi:cation transport regulator ChaC|nr:gamma-glutamylcyclotransferase family protein [Verrucomicrobiota bacterium]
MSKANTIYFAYGSNMCSAQMAERCPGGQALGQAELHGWQFLINIRTYATIEAKLGTVTYGVLWSLTSEDITTLDHYESVAEGMYVKTNLIIQQAGEPMEALVYIDPVCEPGQPKPAYLQTILAGAAQFGLPSAYITDLARDWGEVNTTSGLRA